MVDLVIYFDSVVLTPVLTSEFHNICDCFGIALL